MDRICLCLLTLMMEVLKYSDASTPELSFTVTKFEKGNSTIFHFVCRTNLEFFGCAANFLKNYISEDSLRYYSETNTCYHSNAFYKGRCMPDICACSSCNNFSWNYTSEFESKTVNTSFGCDANIVSGLNVFKGSAVIQYIENNFYNLEPSIEQFILNQENLTTRLITKYTTLDPIKETKRRDYTFGTDHNSVYTLLLLITVIVGMILAILVIKMIMKMINCDRQSTPSQSSVNAKETDKQENKHDSDTSCQDNEDGHTDVQNDKKQNPVNPPSSTKLVTQAMVNKEKDSSNKEESIQLLSTENVKCDK